MTPVSVELYPVLLCIQLYSNKCDTDYMKKSTVTNPILAVFIPPLEGNFGI